MTRLSGNNITLIIVAGLLCLALPVTAVAANVSKVAIAGSNGKTAKVTGGRLQVGAKVQGTVRTVPQGPVTTQPASPSQAVHTGYTDLTTVACKPLVSAPTSSALVVTQVRVSVYDVNGPSALVVIYDGTCTDANTVALVNVPSTGPYVVPFEPGLPIPAGGKLSASVLDNDAYAFADGYRVPASAVP